VMRIAVPICDGHVSPVLDTAARLLVVRRHRGAEVERREIALGAEPSTALVERIAEWGVDVLLCAAVSEPLRRALERQGVRVEMHLCGEAEGLLAAYRGAHWRRAKFRMPGCWRRAGAGRVCVCQCRNQTRRRHGRPKSHSEQT